jgi:hypothetical protein
MTRPSEVFFLFFGGAAAAEVGKPAGSKISAHMRAPRSLRAAEKQKEEERRAARGL